MKNIPNLKILRLDIQLVVEWSPAREVWKVLGPDIMAGLWRHVHLSRLIRSERSDRTCHHITSHRRLSWLWKFGGLYLDTDILVIADILSPWANTSFIGLQSLHPEVGVCQSVIKLSRHHPVLIEWLGLMMEQFDPR